jgi:adenylosuccinate lyase
VQRNAMKVWALPEAEREGAFLNFLQTDEEVAAKVSAEDLAASFDLGYHTRHVDTIFARVFGSA